MARYRKPRSYTIDIGNGSFSGFSVQETRDICQEAFDDISKVANVVFPHANNDRAKIKIRFYDNVQMQKLGMNTWVALGLQFRWGAAINSERKIKRFQALAAVKHEVMHWMGMRHSNELDSVMHPTRSNPKMNATDRKLLTKRWGKNYREFWHTFPDGYKALMREI